MEFLISQTSLPIGVDWDKIYTSGLIAKHSGINYHDCLTAPYEQKSYKKTGHIRVLVQIMVLGIELGMTSEEIREKCYDYYFERKKEKVAYNKSPQKEGRDNKGVKVGSGQRHGNTIRYPKLNRSKRVWKIFYSMFPRRAEMDNWDGEKSDKYPRKK